MKSGGRRKSKESEAMCAGHVEGAHNTGWEQCVSDNPGLRHLESQALGWLDRDIRSQCLIHDGRRHLGTWEVLGTEACPCHPMVAVERHTDAGTIPGEAVRSRLVVAAVAEVDHGHRRGQRQHDLDSGRSSGAGRQHVLERKLALGRTRG